jgi:hypothetical protein
MTRTFCRLLTSFNGSRRAMASLLAVFGFAAVILLAATLDGEARGKHHYPPRVRDYPWREYYQVQPPCTSLDDCDRKAYGESGTRGRMGLGADPAHPEGPGNVSD